MMNLILIKLSLNLLIANEYEQKISRTSQAKRPYSRVVACCAVFAIFYQINSSFQLVCVEV